MVWNLESLKRREASKIEECGLGGAPFLHEKDPQEIVTEKNMKLVKDKIGHIIVTKYETEQLVHQCLAKYPGDMAFMKFMDDLDDIFRIVKRPEEDTCVDLGDDTNPIPTQTESKQWEIVLIQKHEPERELQVT
ncbi:hypothetical protein L6452_19848 [Arctium lappa]|uniref:Uncharacterized protein n=1 Tax=Arctium lappa TaxID=4217 RepID=A0ACB9BA36_ARCLA|nr:hypothetical protein L6452_19848 [Arctium lappa]